MSNQPVYLAENKGKRGEKKEIYIFFCWVSYLIWAPFDRREVMGAGDQGGERSGSTSFGRNFLLHLLKPVEKLS